MKRRREATFEEMVEAVLREAPTMPEAPAGTILRSDVVLMLAAFEKAGGKLNLQIEVEEEPTGASA